MSGPDLYVLTVVFLALKKTGFSEIKNSSQKKLKKPPSKVAHNQPKPFLTQPSPSHSQQPKIDFSYHKNVPPDICSLICAINWLHWQLTFSFCDGNEIMFSILVAFKFRRIGRKVKFFKETNVWKLDFILNMPFQHPNGLAQDSRGPMKSSNHMNLIKLLSMSRKI